MQMYCRYDCTNKQLITSNHNTRKKLASLLTKMQNILGVILWAGAFRRSVTEDSINDHRDIGFSKRSVVNFFRVIFTIQIVTRISCTMMLCTGWIGTSIFSLHGSPGGRGHLFSGTAHGSSFYIARRLLAAALGSSFYTARRPGGNWHHQVNAHVLLSDQFLRSWSIPYLHPISKKNSLLFSRAEFTSPIPNWKHTLRAVGKTRREWE